MAFVILFVGYIAPKLVSGPAASEYDEVTGFCREHGWHNLVYLQTWLSPLDGCVGQTWYLMVDMYLYILAPVVFYPMYLLSKKSDVLAVLWWGVFIFVFTAVPVGLTWEKNWPPSHMFV